MTFGWRGQTHTAGVDDWFCKNLQRLQIEALRCTRKYFSVMATSVRKLGFEPVLILLRSDACLEEVEAFVRDKCVIWCGSDWESFGTAVPNFSGRDCQGFVDGRVMEETISLFTSMSITQAAGTRRSWRCFQSWKLCDIKVIHSEVSGVTTQREHLQGFCKTEEAFQAAQAAPLPYLVGWDASTVLSPMKGSCCYRRAPKTRPIMPLEYVNLGSSSHPEYHGGGLLPRSLDKTVQVTTPTLFAKPGFWGLHQLSSKEILLAMQPNLLGQVARVVSCRRSPPESVDFWLRYFGVC
jgi:hypothetical protein